MTYVTYIASIIESLEELELEAQKIINKKQYCNQNTNNIRASWDDAMDYIHPGVSENKLVAMKLKITVPLDLCDKVDDFGRVICATSVDAFGEKNTLSCTVSANKKAATAYLVILPIPKRTISAAEYLNAHVKGQPKDSVKTAFEQALQKMIPGIFVTGVTKDFKTAEEKGYKDALINYKYSKFTDAVDHEKIYVTNEVIQTERPIDEIKKISNDLIQRFKLGVDALVFEQAQNGQLQPRQVKRQALEYLKQRYDVKTLSKNDLGVIMDRFKSAMYGNYILDPLIHDDSISDILILDPTKGIRVKAKGGRYTSNIHFLSAEDYIKFCEGLAIRNHLDITHESYHVFSDPYSSDDAYLRLNLTTPKVNSSGYPMLQIRKIAKHKRDWNYLIANGMVDETLKNYLIDRARTARGIIFCGKGASGKTTLLNAMLDEIPFNKSVEVIQESVELFSKVHPQIDFKQITKADPLEKAARNGLLVDLDYYIIGEVKGKEAAYLGMAVDSGHRGWCTCHASSAREGIIRLTDYIMQGTDYNQEQASKQLLNMDTLIYLQDFKVCEIYNVVGWDKEKKEIMFEPVYIRPGIHTQFAG